jgi:hypothetical protein
VLLANGTHLDYPISVMPSQALCSEPYKVYLQLPPNVACVNPKVEAAVNWMPGEEFHYEIEQGLDPGTACVLTLMPPTPEAKFEGLPHLMVSIDSTSGPTSRRTFIFGLSTTVNGCSDHENVLIEPTTVSCLP